jgi:predicted aminopeptidase
MRTTGSLVIYASVSLLLFGCGDLPYLTKLGWHQGSVSFRSVPVEEALKDGGMSAEARENILFIQEVKRYGEERLGLKRTNNYTTFSEVKGPILYVITACEKDRLQPYFWSFPIVGRVTYKGFFAQEDAVNEKTSLEKKGYDTYTQRAGGYSTLGWLKDPILSSMLERDRVSLTNLILHEMTHATIYFKGEDDLNEQVATFIGNQGAIDFLSEKYGAQSNEVADAKNMQKDDVLFGRWIDRACRRLKEFYEKEIPRDEKLRDREEIFHSLKEEFKETKFQLKTGTYIRFEKVELNNAVLLAYHRYVHRLANFEPVYNYLGKDLIRVVGLFEWIQSSGENPSVYLEQWMQARGINVPASPR